MRDEQVSRFSKCLYYCRTVATFIFSHIGLMSLVVGYTVVGAFSFEALEADFETQKKFEMRIGRNAVVNSLWLLTHGQTVLHDENWTKAVTTELLKYEQDLVTAVRKYGFDGNEENELQWTFSGALLYSIIVITSIGYGNVAPKTKWGKVVTILYAVFGIPLMLLCMSNIGDTLAQSFKFVYWKVCCFICVRTAKARRARNSRYRRQTSMRSRPGSVRPSSHRSSRHSGGSGRYSDEVSGGSGYYGHMDDVCCKYMDDEVESYSQQRRLPLPNHLIHTQPKSSYDMGRNSPDSAQLEATKVPIILNKYVLESKEDLRVDLPPSVKDGCINNSQSALQLQSGGNSAPKPPHRSTSMQPVQRHSSRRKHHLHHHRYHHPDDLDYDLYEVDSDDDGHGSNKEQVTVPIWLCCALVTGYICGGAALFSFWEEWNFLDASYFCFVTLTTIGFGDLVPGKSVVRDDSRTTLAICSLYLLFGMALLAMSFNLVQEQVATSMKRIGKSIGIIEDDDDDED